MAPLQTVGDLGPQHSRHHHVGNQQIDRLRGARGDLDRVGAAWRRDHAMAGARQRNLEEGTDALLVLGEQDRAGQLADRGVDGLGLTVGCRSPAEREVDAERCASFDDRLHVDGAAALVHDAEDG